MKSAEQWHKELYGKILNSEEEWFEVLRMVQRDALKAAAEKCIQAHDDEEKMTILKLDGSQMAIKLRAQILAMIPEEKQK